MDEATEELEVYIHKVKTDPEVRRSIMTFGDIIDSEKREAAKDTGIEYIMELLNDAGDVPETVVEKLERVNKKENLKQLLKLAARTEDLDSFEQSLDEILEAEEKED